MGETLKRALFGSLFVAIVVIACLYSYFSLFGLMVLVSTIGLYEWLKLQSIDSVPNLILTFMLNYMALGWGRPLLIQLNIGSSTVAIGQMSLVLFVLFILVLIKYKTEATTVISGIIGGLVLISIPCLLLLRMKIPEIEGYSFKLPLLVFILVWLSDTMAYVFGRLMGKHKLFEVLSPKKTIEGWVGGAVFTGIGAMCLFHLWSIGPLWQGAILGILIAIFGVFGDLYISSLKRKVGVKDTGNIIPGHGGILDRFDAFFFAVPVAFAWLAFTSIL